MRANVWRIELFRLLYWTHFVAAVLVPFFTDWAGLDLTQVLILNAWFMGWVFLLEIPTGAVADFFGRKWSLVVGAVVTAAGCLVYTSAPSYPRFLAAEVILALGNCLVSGADEALLYDSLAEGADMHERERHLARLQAAQLVGIVAGALGGGVIAAAWGLRAPLACQAIPIGAAALLATTLVEPTTPVAWRRTAGYRTVLLAGVRRLRADARLRTIALDAVLVGAIAWTLVWLYQPRLAAAGVPRMAFGPLHAILCLAQIGVLRSIGALTSFAGGRARYLRFATLAVGGAILALAAPLPAPMVLVLLMVAMGLGLSRLPIASAAIHAEVDAGVRATMLSTVSGLRTLAICVVSPIAGVLADRGLDLAFAVLGVALLTIGFLSPLGPRHVRD